MDFPFLIGAGRFDSVLLGYPEGTISPIRKIEYYEFNLFTEKYGYGFVYDRIIPYDENVLAVWKPGGQKHSKLNFKCRYIHFSTGDQTLIDLIEGM
ncbi:MAG: hypothetical protein J5850_03080, partial [Clostridia bacterium]|nr:hypothetical protein [Clostridia bacterium]